MANSEFLGVGWQFPIALDTKPDTNGKICTARYEESVRQAIWMILGTAVGERVMRSDFGCGVHDLVFAVNDAGTVGRVASEVRQALIRWEPRIDLLDVHVSAAAGQPNCLLIEISYRVRATNNPFNLVYPFYLE